MGYQVHFHHAGVQIVKSEVFQTFHEAQTCMAKNHVEIDADAIEIVEIDAAGNEGRRHHVTVADA